MRRDERRQSGGWTWKAAGFGLGMREGRMMVEFFEHHVIFMEFIYITTYIFI